MKINTKRQFCSKIGTVLVVLVLNNKAACSSEEGMKAQPCKLENENGCVLLCRDWDLSSRNAAEVLKQIFQKERKNFETCALIFERCTHESDTYNTWEGINPNEYPKIDSLKILHSSIDLNKLNTKMFKNIRRLMMKNTTTGNLRPEAFLRFPHLRRLQLKKNEFLKHAEHGFLQNLTLDHLQIQYVNLNQAETVKFFKNLTGECEIPTIRELDWSHNNFGDFPKNLLTPFPNLNVLILTDSDISSFEEDVFSKGNFTSVYVNKNKIQRLPEKIFRPLLDTSLFVSLEENPLICDCDMEWLQIWVKKERGNLQIHCAIPEGEFLNMEMCPEGMSENSFAARCTPEENLETVLDSNMKKSSIVFNKTSKKSFTIANNEPELIEIILSEAIDLERAFLWYGNYGNATSPQFNCIKILQQEFTVHVKPDVDYLICLATFYEHFRIDVSDCLPLKTKPLHENQPWLTKKSITLSIICIFLLLLFALATGALILYLSVRKNPTLIRGSKRVIEVKRHDKAQLLIMPRGYENLSQTESPSLAHTNPRLPLEPSRSCDTISTVSYVSANQPTQLEILTYRLNRLRDLFQRNNNDLPSPASSLPMQIATPINQRLPPNVDLLFEYEWYTITTTTTTQV